MKIRQRIMSLVDFSIPCICFIVEHPLGTYSTDEFYVAYNAWKAGFVVSRLIEE